jgi:hypothetical protein
MEPFSATLEADFDPEYETQKEKLDILAMQKKEQEDVRVVRDDLARKQAEGLALRGGLARLSKEITDHVQYLTTSEQELLQLKETDYEVVRKFNQDLKVAE